MNTKTKVVIPPYTGWRPRKGRATGNSGTSAMDRKAKREKLGNAQDRAVYKSAHGYKHPSYGRLCRRADTLNK